MPTFACNRASPSPVFPPLHHLVRGQELLGGVLLAVCIFLVGTLAFLGFLWYRIRSLRLDPAAYSALRAGPSDFKAADGNLQES